MKHHLIKTIAILLFSLHAPALLAQNYLIPKPGNALIGGIQYTYITPNDTPTTLAERFDLGLNAIINANPGSTETVVTPNDHGYVKLPTEHILPPYKGQGIVVNLPEMRLYYYPNDNHDIVMSFPIGIGKIGNTIPIQDTKISRKVLNPTWTPGPDVRKYNASIGIKLPSVMQPGPDNPLGPYALYLSIPSYLIHSTIFPESIGRRASFGCIRMNESDIKEFYPLVKPGTPVTIINMPNKVGWNNNELYLEAHPVLQEHNQGTVVAQNEIIQAIESATRQHGVTLVNWQLMSHLAKNPDSVPHEIGIIVKQ